jgi:hypothetical protein
VRWIAVSTCYHAIAVTDFQVCEEIPESWKAAEAGSGNEELDFF